MSSAMWQAIWRQSSVVASTLHYLGGGEKVTDYNEGGDQYGVHLRADP